MAEALTWLGGVGDLFETDRIMNAEKEWMQYNPESIWLAVASFFINNDDANTATA